MPHYQLREVVREGKRSRYFANGQRVTKEHYEHVIAMALRNGRRECFHTESVRLRSGNVALVHHSIARW